ARRGRGCGTHLFDAENLALHWHSASRPSAAVQSSASFFAASPQCGLLNQGHTRFYELPVSSIPTCAEHEQPITISIGERFNVGFMGLHETASKPMINQ